MQFGKLLMAEIGLRALCSSAELSGSLAPGDVFVLCNSSSDDAILSEADMTGTNATTFNGDDAVGLAHNGVIIDAVGSEGADPGNGWDVAGFSNATAKQYISKKGKCHKRKHKLGNLCWS